VLSDCFCSSSTVYFIPLCSADVECGSRLEVDRYLAPSYQAGKIITDGPCDVLTSIFDVLRAPKHTGVRARARTMRQVTRSSHSLESLLNEVLQSSV